ncbi:pyruvate kinase [Synechococcus sp. B60.1]|uniref:pyruvate kinase n=1 Tax=Synechococcus sp. B60.1 TaxID=2964522 RepID=UPI0039C1AD60
MAPALPNLKGLLERLLELRRQVVEGSQTYLAAWGCSADPPAALCNLARYLALRQHDLRNLQLELAAVGLSSLGRCESRVLESLDAVIAILAATQGLSHKGPSYEEFYAGDMALEQHTAVLFGPPSAHRRARIMVTLPGEAAEQPELLLQLLQRGMDVARINCAHDDPSGWEKMVAHLRWAEAQTQRRCKILFDLAGPKIRTGPVAMPPGKAKVYCGDRILLTAAMPPVNSDISCQVACTLPEVLANLQVGATVWIDDGKIGARVVGIEPAGVVLEVDKVAPQGKKLRAEKGLNFPDSQLPIQPLTEKDRQDLDFVVQYADLVGYSFVQQPADLQVLFAELERCQARPDLGLILKIETRQAVKNLPALIATAANRPLGVMIARGDLAVEMGWLRLGEIQEELLWICEAAHVPVVWATQVLDQLTKEGLPSRPELSDAVMSARAECVMLNKGPYLLEAVALLDELLARMQAHQHKKSQRLRALYSWQ